MSFALVVDGKTHEITTMQGGGARFENGQWLMLRNSSYVPASAGETSRLTLLAKALGWTPPHTHGAVYENGKLTDKCRYCDRDLRHEAHL